MDFPNLAHFTQLSRVGVFGFFFFFFHFLGGGDGVGGKEMEYGNYSFTVPLTFRL